MRQFVADAAPDAKGCLLVSGKKAKHLAGVLRVACGDMLYVRLPGGALQQMTVAHVDAGKKTVLLQVAGERADAEPPSRALPAPQAPGREFWLFQFVAKPPKMDLIVRQATECGVSVVVPVAGSFCQNGSIDSARKKADPADDRWQRIVTEAQEQSGSAVRTRITECMGVPQAMALWQEQPGSKAAVVLSERSDGCAPLHRLLSAAADARLVAVMVGAEGGIAPEEIEFVQGYGFERVHFATNILRCETAALYGMAAVQSALTENSVWHYRE